MTSRQPARPLKPIVSPDAPPGTDALWRVFPALESTGLLRGAGLAYLGVVVSMMLVSAIGPAMLLLPLLAVLGAIVGYAATSRQVFRGPRWKHKGTQVHGQALDMIEDIQSRFLYARKLIGEVPTGIDWSEVRRDVDTLMWESLDHAAQVSLLDVEIHEMRYANPGTPQAAMKRQLEERRAEHWQVLLDHQRQSDALARAAGNALAASKVALARTGRLAALEVVIPSRRALAARGALAEAQARLAILAEAWAELDETGALDAERLGLNEGKPEERPG